MTGVCTETDTCFVDCVTTFPCEEINASVAGTNNAFGRCMLGC